ncbi:MAG TPA: phage tail sheath family protein, partial [Bacteroidetes bacterium]|nr:phage tail sheath family protein [Bacteroidota bacterium]
VGTFFLFEAMQMYFANGGGPCYVISVDNFPEATATATQNVVASKFGTAQTGALAEILKLDEPTLILFPEATGLSLAAYKGIVESGLQVAAEMQDRFTLIDTPKGLDLTTGTTNLTSFRTALSSENLKFGAAYYPFLEANLAWSWDIDACTYGGTTLKSLKDSGSQDYNKALEVLANTDSLKVILPPSPAVAGVYAKIDNDQGVWVAPANVALQSVIKPVQAISEGKQASLNIDATAGKSINAIRNFTGRGTLVWGARTLAGNDNEWRYVPVRRLFLSAEESIRKATAPFVFSANDAQTWVKVSSMIASYLDSLWRQGALMGAKAEDAYFVKVGLGTTMTQENVLNGEMIVEVGLAAVRPAEFIVMKFYHHLNQ